MNSRGSVAGVRRKGGLLSRLANANYVREDSCCLIAIQLFYVAPESRFTTYLNVVIIL